MLVTTTRFRELTDQVAGSLGCPDLRILEVAHPLGGTPEHTILQWADGAVEAALALYTAS